MVNRLLDSLTQAESVLTGFTVFVPGILMFLTYRSFSGLSSEKLNRRDVLLIILFTLLFEVIQPFVSTVLTQYWYSVTYFFILPIILGVIADISHRLTVAYVLENYRHHIVENHLGSSKYFDVTDTARWETTISKYAHEAAKNLNNAHYCKIQTEQGVIEGYIIAYSGSDIELMEYTPDNNSGGVTRVNYIIPKDSITYIEIYGQTFSQRKNFSI